ncbi:Hypothetical protein HDN1F_22550 [gamma proteobacterium HdN1]|nr:Hypothetical protein HDN1F_22550 [gamma proteobacterium HdN1]
MTAPAIMPERRDYKFYLPWDRVLNWNGVSPSWGQFFNTFSVFFPAGERFFINTVRDFREQIRDPELEKAVKAFIGQEAMHTREHVEYNKALTAAGVPADALDAAITRVLETVYKILPKELCLAATVSLEHLTAILGDLLLKNPQALAGSDERYIALWMWHALEETEHKAVTFDLYQHVMGTGVDAYLLRVAAFVVVNAIFIAMLYPAYFSLLVASGQIKDARDVGVSFQQQWGKPGYLRQLVPDWLDFFRPSFHPWQHDNRRFLGGLKALQKSVRRFAA